MSSMELAPGTKVYFHKDHQHNWAWSLESVPATSGTLARDSCSIATYSNHFDSVESMVTELSSMAMGSFEVTWLAAEPRHLEGLASKFGIYQNGEWYLDSGNLTDALALTEEFASTYTAYTWTVRTKEQGIIAVFRRPSIPLGSNALEAQSEPPRTFACHHAINTTCRACKSLVERWKAAQAMKATSAK